MILQLLNKNPVARAEHLHQQRGNFPRNWRRFPTIFALGLGAALVSTPSVLIRPQIGLVLHRSPADVDYLLSNWFGTLIVLLGALIMIQHLSFAVVAVQLASATIAREKQGRTWESLLLTGIDARQIVIGKWWATQQSLWVIYRRLLGLRFGAVLWLGLFSLINSTRSFFTPPAILTVILIGAIVAVFPLCYAGFTATLGLLASLVTRSETSAYRLAMLLYAVSLAISISMIMVMFVLPFGGMESETASIIPGLFITPLDSGMLPLIGLVASGLSSDGYIVGLLLCMALHVALTFGLLRLAQWIAVRQHASVPARVVTPPAALA